MTVRPFGLSPEQTRVLGVLAEKAATTPEAYPLSSNAVRTACNQRSSRDPVVSYDEETVKAAMLSLRERDLAKTIRGAGSRVFKHAHTLDRLGLAEPEVAVLAVLMLRGAQTVGEIKTRTERQHPFAALEEVDAVLRALATRPEPLLEQLARGPGQKEARWRHLLEVEPEPGEEPPPEAPEADLAPPPVQHESLAEEATARSDGLEEISRRLDALEHGLEELRRELDAG
jgi:hypothetical protein